jgi:ribosomal protein S18 acetylase RimI-like enzyme
MNINKASFSDIPALTSLVNQSYRGESARQGWTHEADLFEGDRMTGTVLQKMMEQPGAAVYKLVSGGELLGCVYLKKEGIAMYLGMLTVSPAHQGSGMGKQLLQFSETHAREQGCESIYMRVISSRSELVDWYLRNGYTDTRKRIPFHGDGADLPKQPISFAVLEKRV